MSVLRVLSWRGDSSVEWDARLAEQGDPEAAAAIREAERIFREVRSRGATAFVVEDNDVARRIEQFDPSAKQIVLVPRMAGGA